MNMIATFHACKEGKACEGKEAKEDEKEVAHPQKKVCDKKFWKAHMREEFSKFACYMLNNQKERVLRLLKIVKEVIFDAEKDTPEKKKNKLVVKTGKAILHKLMGEDVDDAKIKEMALNFYKEKLV